MTRVELQIKIEELGLIFSLKNTTWGSQYIRISNSNYGITYRLSDHIQPSHYQCRNYVDVKSIDEIYSLTLESLEKGSKINTTDEWIFDYELDGFIENPNYISSNNE